MGLCESSLDLGLNDEGQIREIRRIEQRASVGRKLGWFFYAPKRVILLAQYIFGKRRQSQSRQFFSDSNKSATSFILSLGVVLVLCQHVRIQSIKLRRQLIVQITPCHSLKLS